MMSIACGNRIKAINVATMANIQSLTRICAVVDADVDAFLGTKLPDNVFSTDQGDIEACAFFGPAGGAVFMAPLFPPARYTREEVDGMVDDISAVAFAVGRLRLDSVRRDWKLSLSGLPFGASPTPDALNSFVDMHWMAGIIAARSHPDSICERCVDRHFRKSFSTPLGDRDSRLCRGHDIAQLVAIAVAKRGGPSLAGRTVETLLKAALHACRNFRELALYRDLENWGAKAGVTVWHDECANAA
ncbi:hypothetical protein [Ornithinimicrobium pekingense]|nr:hypothetical protein [Ornithinimicrobium pekingense]